MPSNAEFGNRLRKVREWRSVSQEELGRFIKGGQTRISRLENGRVNFTLHDVITLGHILHFRLDIFCLVDAKGFDLMACLLPLAQEVPDLQSLGSR